MQHAFCVISRHLAPRPTRSFSPFRSSLTRHCRYPEHDPIRSATHPPYRHRFRRDHPLRRHQRDGAPAPLGHSTHFAQVRSHSADTESMVTRMFSVPPNTTAHVLTYDRDHFGTRASGYCPNCRSKVGRTNGRIPDRKPYHFHCSACCQLTPYDRTQVFQGWTP